MFKLNIVILFLAFLTSETYCDLNLQTVSKISTDALQTNFKSPNTLLPGTYTLELNIKPETCSIRINLETFSFNQPIQNDNSSAFVCGSDLDLLKLSALGIPLIELSVLCGELSGQHLYLPTRDYDEPILKATITKKLILTAVYLGVLIPGIEKPSWNITLIQLPCQIEDDQKTILSVAPIGCLQYHTEKEGIIESLNFLNGLGHYIGNLNYAICFKRYPTTCGIKLVAINFDLAANGNSSLFTERDCDTLGLDVAVGLEDILRNKDYLIIPNGVNINAAGLEVFASKYCGQSLKNIEVRVKTQGPLYIGVITDGLNDLLNLEIGFKIKYELLTEC